MFLIVTRISALKPRNFTWPVTLHHDTHDICRVVTWRDGTSGIWAWVCE